MVPPRFCGLAVRRRAGQPRQLVPKHAGSRVFLAGILGLRVFLLYFPSATASYFEVGSAPRWGVWMVSAKAPWRMLGSRAPRAPRSRQTSGCSCLLLPSPSTRNPCSGGGLPGGLHAQLSGRLLGVAVVGGRGVQKVASEARPWAVPVTVCLKNTCSFRVPTYSYVWIQLHGVNSIFDC